MKNITCQASAVHKLRTENQIDITTVNCNSYAALVVTAQVCNILQTDMESDLNVSKVLKLMFNGKNGLAVLYPDFISKAVIINLGKREIPMSLLSFQSQQVVRDIRTLSALSREEVENLVIIPSEQYRQEEDCFLINRSNQMKHLIYLNQLPEKITKVLNNVIYWDTYLYTNLISNSIGSRELKIEIPLVMVTGNSKEKMKLISELQKKFTSEGFRCIGMIDDIMACICNLWYVIPYTDMNDICELLIKYFNVDILICSVERKTVCGELDDLIIILEEGNSEIKQIENKLFLSDRKFEIEQVYQKIIKYYDNNEDLIQ